MQRVIFKTEDSNINLLATINYNYTFHSCGVIGTILLLNIIVSCQMQQIIALNYHIGSLLVIIIINKDYLHHFKLECYKEYVLKN